MLKFFVMVGSINAFAVMALGAFGAHGLKDRLTEEMLAIYQTAVQYHMFHALGLILIGILGQWLSPSSLLQWSGWLMLSGILIFSGSLYILSISGIKWLGAITPIGGVAFIIAWLLVAIATMKSSI